MAKDLAYKLCPRCRRGFLKPIGERTGGFSGKKAAVGGVLLGPVGLVAGALGRRKVTYMCDKCNYTIEA
ncbi:MAG: hypothetical protein IJC48_07650 [Clostridia bacterium]|nr:hypothetical protein [Clostridia bacterium]